MPLVLLVAACATIGSGGEGDVDLPTSGVGPFRKLNAGEVIGLAPFVFDDNAAKYRDPAVLALDADPASMRVALYATAQRTDASGTRDVIVRTRADDARSFFGTSEDRGKIPPAVVVPDQAWEAGKIGQPSVVQVNGQIWLYYAAAGGIGLARSDDGLTFRKDAAPVLAPDPSVAWETTAPSAPSVARYPDGRFRMMYAAGNAIGEAASDDGVRWKRLDADPSTPAIDPVLVPADPADPASLAPGEKPPFDTFAVGDPCLLPRITPSGRLQVRVLYTGLDAPPGTAGHSGTIGFAARYGDSGPLSRQPAAVYSVGKNEAAPALFQWSGGAMLYVQQDKSVDSSHNVPAIAAAIAPVTLTFATPLTFADGP